MPTNKEVDAFMRKVDPEHRYYWCSSYDCDCEGCVNGEGEFPWPKRYWVLWLVRNLFKKDKSDIDEAMEGVYPEFRWQWCEAEECACNGAANCGGFPYSKFSWWLWTLRHPEPSDDQMDALCNRWHNKHRRRKLRVSKTNPRPIPPKYGASDEAKPVFMKETKR